MTGFAGIIAAVLFFGVPLVGFALWPLWGRSGRARTFLPVAPDPREPFLEQKRQVLGALRELDFEHEAGHVSDEDYAELRARYESEAAGVLTELDRLGAPPPRPPKAPRPARSAGWRHPFALGAGAVALVVFGVALGGGIARYSAPDPTAGLPMPGSRPLASLEPPAPATSAPATSAPRTVSPEMLRGMLQAARTSLFEGRYGEAIAAYQAVLKRDPKNVDAMTHLALVAALAGHADEALVTFDKALAIDPDYPPALLYKGQVLYDIKRDRDGAVRTWERFLKVVPSGEDHERVKRLIAESRAKR
ncbi:MAG TPA: tetratricopeptide repeat protein [Methylomirabilota bacterium]|jgi:cytochrome c-type biogenesis protein CcmH/NrfG